MRALVSELKKYDIELYRKPRWLVLNKIDLLPEDTREKIVRAFLRKLRWKGKVVSISALTGDGCQALVYAVMDHVEAMQQAAAEVNATLPSEPAQKADKSPARTSRSAVTAPDNASQ